MTSPLILKEDERSFLVQVPVGVPLLSRHRYGSEGFQSWFLRHFAPEVPSRFCQSVAVGKQSFLLVPKTADPLPADRLSIKESSAGRVTVLHPYLPRFDWEPPNEQETAALPPLWLDSRATNAYRWDHALGRAFPGWIGTRLGESILYQSENRLSDAERSSLEASGRAMGLVAGYWKRHERAVQKKTKTDLCPELIWGDASTVQGPIKESGVCYDIDFAEGYSFGLFLDQRENRYRVRHNLIEAGFPVISPRVQHRPQVLNTFAYTCGFSVCAALAGAEVVSVDLSRKYLAWGKRNFVANGLDPEKHEFLYGDVFGWIKRFQRRERRFDLIVLDPPTFSRSKEWGAFKVTRDMAKLIEMVVPLLNSGGRLLVSSNAATWEPELFTASIAKAIRTCHRRIGAQVYATQPWDFGVLRAAESYLKTWWLEVLD